ncbi:MAG: cupin domain-containing protein [Methylococcaceae bacterium]|nr:cupin domain-containing protein [Methylococcaceae bacterium]
MEVGNLFECLPDCREGEDFEILLASSDFRLERIVSMGQITPEGEWFDQDKHEWVILLRGAAGLSVEGEAEIRVMNPGDYIYLPAHVRHRVEWTSRDEETVWLALHHGSRASA